MMYEVVGTGAAPSFFSVDAVGRVYTRGLLRTDRALTYVVSKGLNIALHKKKTQTLLFLQLRAFNADGAEQP